MSDILNKILDVKADEVAAAKKIQDYASLRREVESDRESRAQIRGFGNSLRSKIAAGGAGVIAEIAFFYWQAPLFRRFGVRKLMIASLVLGVTAIMRRDVAQHRADRRPRGSARGRHPAAAGGSLPAAPRSGPAARPAPRRGGARPGRR